MRWSCMFIPTLRENPADAEFPSQQLLIRGGFVRMLGTGYSWLPLGQRTLLKLASIVRQEMNAVGAQEFLLPGVEGFGDIARNGIRSYRELPQIWFQVQMSLRVDPRLKSGPLRSHPPLVSNSCSLDIDSEARDTSYRIHRNLYARIFERCGLPFVIVEAAAGGDGDASEKFMVRTDAGEDRAVFCACGYAAKLERARSTIEKPVDAICSGPPVEVHTPGQKTIADICDFLKVSAAQQIKSLVYVVDGRPFLFLLRGDHQLNESKVIDATGGVQMRAAEPGEIRDAFGADAGSLGPVGVTTLPVYADLELNGRRNLTCGANRNDYHLQQVTPDVDFKPIWADLRTVEAGEGCIRCGKPLEICRALEIGNLMKLGARNSGKVGSLVLTAEGKQAPVATGLYSMSLDRIVLSAVESHHDNDGICWPVSIAPFPVVLTAINYKESVKEAADRLYAEILADGIDALLDDRQERAGVKFKDADLIGIPYRVVIGDKVKQGQVELFDRATKQKQLLEIGAVVPTLRAKLTPG